MENSASMKFAKALPCVFPEKGAIMDASVLNSRTAVELSILIVRAFVQLHWKAIFGRRLPLTNFFETDDCIDGDLFQYVE